MKNILIGILFIFMLFNILYAQESSDEDSTLSDNEIVKKPPDSWFGKDKAKHFMGSLMLASTSSFVSRTQGNFNKKESMQFGVGFTLSLGVLKAMHRKLSTEHRTKHQAIAVFL